MSKKLVSFVIPVYNEEAVLPSLHQALAELLADISQKYTVEVWFINDGSWDRTSQLLHELHNHDHRFNVIEFARNFGHQAAITAGLDAAQGDAVIIMDADLQDPPEVSLELLAKWEEGFEVVYAQRRQRGDTWFKRFTAHWFYRILNALSDISIPPDTGDFRLLDRKAADALRQFREHNRFMRGLVSFVGFKQTAVLFDRADRLAGDTHYPLGKMIKLAIDGITSFSTVPLRLIAQTGTLIAGLSLLGIAYAIVMRFFFSGVTVSGWTTLVLCILFLGGMQMIMLGILGLYLGRIYIEVQNRPLYIVSTVLSRSPTKRH